MCYTGIIKIVKMKRIKIVVLLAVLYNLTAKAQVKDISFTFSPTGAYTFWDKKAGMADGVLVGGKIGFGFGEYLELRGIYQQSLDLNTNFENFGLANYDTNLFTKQEVKLTRWGGEFKANIGTKKLSPYLTIGTGIQAIELDNADKLEQIYAGLGLGIKFNIAKRLVFTLEGRGTTYKFNAAKNLLANEDKTLFGVTDADFSNERLMNWSVMGSLQFYLGGRKPGTLSPLDQAYLNKFKGGFKGLQFVLEPSANRLTFDDNSLFRDTWMLGGYAGIDFNEYVGLRAFYFQATEDDELSTSFDKLSMYGLEFRANLNDGNGVVPYLILGGGYLNPDSNYLGKDSLFVSGTEFASAGLGLTIPLGSNVSITGGARALVTSGTDITDINEPKDLQSHLMYNVGVKFNLGKKSDSTEKIYQDNLNKELEAQQAVNNDKIQHLKSEYQNQVKSLEIELEKAYESKDVDKVIEILEEKKEVTESLKQVEQVEGIQEEQVKTNSDNGVLIDTTQEKLIQMTPKEFESLIERILNNLDETPKTKSNDIIQFDSTNQQEQFKYLNNRIDTLEKLLLDVNVRKKSNEDIENNGFVEDDMSIKILNKLEELNNKIEGKTNNVDEHFPIKDTKTSTKLENKEVKPTEHKIDVEVKNNNVEERIIVRDTVVVEQSTKRASENTQESEKENVAVEVENIQSNDSITATKNKVENVVLENKKIEEESTISFLNYNSTSAFGGVSFGDVTTANFGARMYYDVKSSNFQLMPEVFVGIGKDTSYGLSANVIYQIAKHNNTVKPYLGVGGGYGKINDQSDVFSTIIVGAELPVLLKNFYVDFSTRNLLDNNQLSVGYKFEF